MENKAPSTGEANAITGYGKQYEYSASVLFRHMQDGALEAISIAEPAAGIFDDLVFHAEGRVIATQIKSEKNAKYVSLGTELKGTLIAEMAASWLSLKERFQTENVHLRYIFAGLFSASDTALANTNAEGARHSSAFADFISRAELDHDAIASSIWSDAVTDLRIRSGLDESAFLHFLQHLELKDERALQANAIANFAPTDRSRITAIQSLLPALVRVSNAGQRYTEQDLIDRLGWRSRLSQHNIHVFPVPPDYQENEATEKKLLDVVEHITQGYMALIGPPGTGKSTLLQRGLFSTHNYSISRYLAFHPGQRHGLGRAEAGEFLNDIISELRSQGLYASKFSSDNLSGLRSEFAKQLEAAGARYTESGRKTLIVIDGLDHVPREENPKASFFAELPAASAIPEGVVIILGTQRVDLPGLHATIVQQAKEANRSVTIEPMSRVAVFALADAANLPSFIDRDILFERCNGHPLAARYFIEALRFVHDADLAVKVLSDSNGLGQSLQQIYERVWQKLDTARSSRSALGLLARAEGSLSCEQLAEGSDDEAVEDILATAKFLLSIDRQGRLSIFHNSFRLFVAQETGRRFSRPSNDLERAIHLKLAAISDKAQPHDPQYWFQLRYLSRAGDLAGVLALGTASYFRKSLRAFRPSGEIYTDLRLTYAAVKPTRDRVVLLNRLLVEKELDYRLEAVSNLDFVELLLELGEVELATRHALEVGKSGEGWLELVDYYWFKGDTERARQVFEANEPLEILFAGEGFNPYNDMKRARSWIERAQRFRPLDKLAALVDSIVVKTHGTQDDDDDSNTRRLLKFSLALGAVSDQHITDLSEIKGLLQLTDGEAACLGVHAAELAFQDERRDEGLKCLAFASNSLDTAHPSWRRAAALIARDLGNLTLAKRLASTLTLPRFDRQDTMTNDEDDVMRAIIETAFLSAALGVSIPEEAGVRSLDNSTFLANAHTKIRELGALKALAHEQEDRLTMKALKSLVLFFAHARPDPSDFDAYRFFGSLGSIARHLVQIAEACGQSAFDEFVAAVDERLAIGDNNFARSEDFQVKFAEAVFDLNGDSNAAQARIDLARAAARSDRTPHEAVDSYASRVRAYCHIGIPDDARAALDAMHEDTFGYWLRAKKEPQYTFWAWSFLKACETSPSTMEKSSLAFAQFILGMDETEGDETAARLVGDLLDGAGVSPSVLAGITSRLLKSDLSTWPRIVEAALASIAKHDPTLGGKTIIACAGLVVPFAAGGIERCLKVALPGLTPAEREGPISILLASVQRWCPPSVREIILKEIIQFAPEAAPAIKPLFQDAADVAETLRRITHGEPSDDSSERGVSMDIEADSLESLLASGDGATNYGERVDYSYARAAERLFLSANKEDIEKFIAKRPHVLADAKAACAISRRYLDLGLRKEAARYFELAEKAAFSGHWSTFLGGQKLAVQRLRLELDGKAAIERGFEILVDELSTGQTNGSSLFLNLDDVLELIADPIPFREFWSETEEHLKEYREYRLAQPVDAIDSVQTYSDVLAFIVAYAYKLSCPEVTIHARRAGHMITSSGAGVVFAEKLASYLREYSDGARERAALLHSLRAVPSVRSFVVNEACMLVKDDDFVAAAIGRKVLHDIGVEIDDDPETGLPAFYTLLPSNSDQTSNFDPPPGLGLGQRPVWSDDPWTWTTMLRGPLLLLSDATEVPLELLRRRCASFMTQEGGKSAFGPDAEDQILQQLRRLHLQFTYRRPMAPSCLRAFGKVVRELERAGAVDQRVFHLIWNEMGAPSISASLPEDSPRPDWLEWPEVTRQKYGGIDSDQWLEHCEIRLRSPLLPNEFILAEDSYFLVQAVRSSADVHRTSFPSHVDVTEGIAGLPRLFSHDYLQPMYKRADSPLVCRIPGNLFGDFRNEAITICPFVAQHLSWSRSDTHPLELFDASENIVARTIRWVEGTKQKAQYDAERFATGQSLLLTSAGRAQLETAVGPLRLSARVVATFSGEQGERDRREIVAANHSDRKELLSRNGSQL
ncbi:ATP-binding protein [Agrobacterium rubi]|uniref:AAA family ATPase n=1 Tax=Agrobacterium rubi TaxID=28099 RepID=UPI0015734958|nr:ATP-binding protein [Agrobacterium rubi]NTF08895.1 ATP-binding protein [Agrobacterium rubi]NTF21166.1 ATP-binding protein [Agrobacterium rubi]NTF28023.1 ATP-binding protein [Agrobacterium rubi]